MAVPFQGTSTAIAQAYDINNAVLPTVAFDWMTSNAQAVNIVTTTETKATVSGLRVSSATLTAVVPHGPSASVAVTVTPGSYLVYDTFSETTSDLTTHVPDVNVRATGWTVTGAPGAGIAGAAALANGRNSSVMVALVDAGASDVVLGADWIVPATSFVSGQVVFRASDASHYLAAAYTADANAGSIVMQILRVTPETGTVPLVTVGAARPGWPGTHRLEVHTAGSLVQFFVDGILHAELNTTFNVTATGVGLRWADVLRRVHHVRQFLRHRIERADRVTNDHFRRRRRRLRWARPRR